MNELNTRRNHLETLLNAGKFNPLDWAKLAADFKASGRLSGAATIEEKAAHYESEWGTE